MVDKGITTPTHENTEMSLGRKLSVLAKLKGLTQEQIAKKCTMSRISVNRFFRSHTEIRAGDLGALLNILGINLEQLIDTAIEKQISGGPNNSGGLGST